MSFDLSEDAISVAYNATASHLLAYAVTQLFPDSFLGKSGATEVGFYHDFLMKTPLKQEFLHPIQTRMQLLLAEELLLRTAQMMKNNASELLDYKKQPFLADLVREQDQDLVEIVEMGEACHLKQAPTVDLHLVKAFQLTGVIQLTEHKGKKALWWRIQGVAAPDKKNLKKLLKQSEDIKDYAHEKLGNELGLFNFISGRCYWESKGIWVKKRIESLLKEHYDRSGFEQIETPDQLLTSDLDRLALHKDRKLLNLAPHTGAWLLFDSQFSSRGGKLPRYFEFRKLFFRQEQEVIRGLCDLKRYHADLFHLFCEPNLVVQEVGNFLRLVLSFIKSFGFDYTLKVSSQVLLVGNKPILHRAQQVFKTALEKVGEKAFEGPSEALTGPRLEVYVKDIAGQSWPLSWVEIDTFHPKKLKLYENKKFFEVISGSLIGSIERLIALLIEKNAGKLPSWLVPEQVRILPVSNRHAESAFWLQKQLSAHQIRATVSLGEEKLGAKIYMSQKERIPYLIVIGDQEQKELSTLLVRMLSKKENVKVPLEQFICQVQKEAGINYESLFTS